MRKLNVNQRRAISDLFINLSNSIITLSIITPFLSKNILYYENFINLLFGIIVSFILILLSNNMLK